MTASHFLTSDFNLDYATQRLRELELNNETLSNQVVTLTKQLEDSENRDAANDYPTDGRQGCSTRTRRSTPTTPFEKSIERAGQRFLVNNYLFILKPAVLQTSDADVDRLKQSNRILRQDYINSLPEEAAAIFDEDRVVDFVSSPFFLSISLSFSCTFVYTLSSSVVSAVSAPSLYIVLVPALLTSSEQTSPPAFVPLALLVEAMLFSSSSSVSAKRLQSTRHCLLSSMDREMKLVHVGFLRILFFPRYVLLRYVISERLI